MIPRDYVTEWSAEAPWNQDVQVEQDLVISRALVEMYAQPVVAAACGFRGRTAIYKLHVRPAARYSEDIDLVQTVAEPIGKSLDAIRQTLDPWLGKPKRTFSEGRATLLYRFRADDPTAPPMRLKIEINTREHFSVRPFEERTFKVASRWFSGEAAIRTYALDELLGTKLRALYQRRKGRDLFDLWTADRRTNVNWPKVVECFEQYMQQEEAQVSRAQMGMNILAKLGNTTFAADVPPLIAAGTDWDLAVAGDWFCQEILPLLPGEPWKGVSG